MDYRNKQSKEKLYGWLGCCVASATCGNILNALVCKRGPEEPSFVQPVWQHLKIVKTCKCVICIIVCCVNLARKLMLIVVECCLADLYII